MTRLSLAQQVAQLEDTVVENDPEDAYNNTQPNAHLRQTEEDDFNDTAGGREHYVEVGPSMMRKLHESVADPRYDGVKTSRSKIFDDDEDMSSEEGSEALQSESHSNENGSLASGDDEDGYKGGQPFGKVVDEDGTDDEDDEDEDDNSQNGFLKSSAVEDGDRQLAETLRKTREQDREKGKAVTKQLAMWDTLLDARIRLQKSVVSANSLPLPGAIASFTSSDSGRAATHKLLEVCFELSDDLFQLQEVLLATNDSIEAPPRKRRKIGTDDDATAFNPETDLRNATTAVSNLEAAYHPSLVQTLSKWSQKVQSVAPTALLVSGRTTFSSSSRNLPGQAKTAVDLIEETTAGGKAVARTHVRRAGQKRRIGEDLELNRVAPVQPAALEAVDVDEVFDDADFYQQLLRDVIDSRAGKECLVGLDAADAWARKQKKAQKAERALANKDRRIRYDVHEKLQNYMVPVPVSRGGWHEEQIDELFASLLGKGFEGAAQEDLPKKRNTGTDGGAAANGDLAILVDGGLGGLRVF
ncbi:rRNA-processing protein bfr2 [Tulasnella sp. JGI-2019a]|nr:rRNA-processing protein bfr2 [Tulasnella sp. JGI-2019a]KAG9000958.1 rRNA-processing protein bfr2 [Tulasnella sp. JGI-2019a]